MLACETSAAVPVTTLGLGSTSPDASLQPPPLLSICHHLHLQAPTGYFPILLFTAPLVPPYIKQLFFK